jgi:hypothetical protein
MQLNGNTYFWILCKIDAQVTLLIILNDEIVKPADKRLKTHVCGFC